MKKGRTYRRNIYTTPEVAWSLAMAGMTLFAVYRVPADIVLGIDRGFFFEALDVLLAVMFLTDLPLTFLFAQRRGSIARRNYIKVLLVPDLIAAVAAVAFSRGSQVELLVLVKVIHVTYFVSTWRQQLMRTGNIVRLGLFVYWLMILIHVTACGWIYMRETLPASNPLGKYIEAVYWSVTTLTTIGYGDITPQNQDQMIFAIFVMLLGFLMMGYLIGNIAGLLNRTDPLRAQYAASLEEVSSFVQYNNIPANLKHRIIDYFTYMWHQRAAFDEPHILHTLPHGLKSEVSLHLKRDVIQRVPFFNQAGENLIREVANEMRPIVITPGEAVFHYGDPANNMYFINRGTIEVRTETGEVINTLADGDFFGEMALLEKRRRMATVVAIDYTDLYVLDAIAFNRILEGHPDFKEFIETVARQRASTGGRGDSSELPAYGTMR
ncbi:MAG: cyclic nucleotide-binding domain-containing protein [Ignavibacteria bacterium]|nr:cyclic nucleotide-binding domain-containing protein [Ignavibacteria bacterium]